MMLNEFLAIALVGFLGALSPGPALILISHQTISHNRRIGFITLLGVLFASIMHIAYCLYGLKFLASQSIIGFQIAQYVGAIYLFYLGWITLRNTKKSNLKKTTEYSLTSHFIAFKKGLIINILNPENPLFFMSIFSQILNPSMPFNIQIIFAIELIIISFCCLSCFIIIFSSQKFNTLIFKSHPILKKCLGGALMLFSLRLISFQI